MSEIKKYFISRFGEDGRLVELDYSQLEVVALAVLSGDEQLKEDLRTGKDLHAISAKALFGPSFTPAERRIAKQLSFQLQYGAGPKSMAEKNHIPMNKAQDFINNYYKRYEGVGAYHHSLIQEVENNRTSSYYLTEKDIPAGISTFKSITGKRYTFKEYDTPDWMKKDTGFKPTQIKNYPVQGFATGDIMPIAVGKIFRALKNSPYTEDIKLINTIHDSIMFDISNDKLIPIIVKHIIPIMENVPDYLYSHYNIDFDLALKVKMEVGKNWYEMAPIDISTY